ncbi:MAG: Unknown protein [uncultured Sulfurovum sp.]|uniref:AsmA-like C-terminal domain-containing protein n=1 Tax=uncultured Sulfurovum sp. TaxID=269237 RepID=A0A6S6RXC6_9BACT|nr:MAG: Unknown protein [uncultured Sulfurovum sp.]
MKILSIYIIWLFSFFTLILFYFLGTELGHLSIAKLAEYHYSQKMENKLEILSLNIEEYPKIRAEIKINDQALLTLNGFPDKQNMDLNYHLRGDTFTWDGYSIDTPADVTGKMRGAFSNLFISGKGKIFDGNITYSFIRKPNRLETMKLGLQSVNSEPLLEFLSYKDLLRGEVDVFMDFDYFTSYRREGSVKVRMNKGTIPKLSEEIEVDLDAEVLVKDLLHEFFADIKSDLGKLRVANGHYNRAANITTADYGLHVNDLSDFEDFLDHKYHGSLNTAGSLKYDNGDLSLIGDTISYGGFLDYNYRNQYLDMNFKGVSLEQVLQQLSFPALLSAKIEGSASYDIANDLILVNTKLKEARFRRTKMTDTIYEMIGIDVLKDVYDDSVFTAGYQNYTLTSLLEIENGINHLYLKDTRMNSKTNTIEANFEVLLDGEEFVGEISGTLEDPKVSLDMTQLIGYQINKSIDTFFGTGKPLNRKNAEERLDEMQNELNNQMQNFEMENVERKTRSFLDGFFD